MSDQRFIRLVFQTAAMLFANALFVTAVIAQTSTPAAINSYAKQVDRFSRSHQPRIFGRIVSETTNQDQWRKFASKNELESAEEQGVVEAANVWVDSGKVVKASFTLTSQSGDWMHYIQYYFRKDGTLAKVHSRLNTFYGNLTVVREKLYDTRGGLLRSTTLFRDLHTQKPTKRRSFDDRPFSTYLRTRDLPFSHLL